MWIAGDQKMGAGSVCQSNEVVIARVGRDAADYVRIKFDGT